MGKKLCVNSACCDARNLTEETLAVYDAIEINSASLIVSAESQQLLNRHCARINCASTRVLPGNVNVATINGKFRIAPGTVVQENTYLILNGLLEIGDGSEEVLRSYVGMEINGQVVCPESLSGYIRGTTVNGQVLYYPDGATVLRNNAVIDRLFQLRAREKHYWGKRMIIVDPQLDVQKLAEKGARFSANEILLGEDKAEAMMELVDERSEIILLPAGTGVITDDVTLTESLVRKYGTKLYIMGDLTVEAEGEQALASLTYLKVCGDVTVAAELRDLLTEKAEVDGKIQVRTQFQGYRIEDKPSVRIQKWMLEQNQDGLWVEDCAIVTLEADIPAGLILERLHILDCATVHCTPEQEGAVHIISEDCAYVGPKNSASDEDRNTETVSINSASCVL